MSTSNIRHHSLFMSMLSGLCKGPRKDIAMHGSCSLSTPKAETSRLVNLAGEC